jgi:curved DNA-binding protein CbpA
MTHYELLRVDPRADAATIRAAYRRLAKRFHPDRDPTPDGHRAMVLINGAYATLKHPDRRAAYDALVGVVPPPPMSPQPPAPAAPVVEPRRPAPTAPPPEDRLSPLARRRAMAGASW